MKGWKVRARFFESIRRHATLHSSLSLEHSRCTPHFSVSSVLRFSDLTQRTQRKAEGHGEIKHGEIKIEQMPAQKAGGLYKTCNRQ